MDEEVFYIVSVCAADYHGPMTHALTVTGVAKPGADKLSSQEIYKVVMGEVASVYREHYRVSKSDSQLIVLNYHVVQNNPQAKVGPLGIV